MNHRSTPLAVVSLIVVAQTFMLVGCVEQRGGSTAGETPVENGSVVAESTTSPPDAIASETVPDANQIAEANTPNAPTANETPAKSAEPPKTVADGVSESALHTARGKKSDNSGITELTFDDIKFEMKEKEEPFRRELLTPAIEGLHGKTVRLRGYILPSFQQRGLTQFVLMRDNMECCFGPGAWIYDCVIVEMKSGKTTDFTVRPVAVEGTFEIDEFLDGDGKHLAVYRILGESAK